MTAKHRKAPLVLALASILGGCEYIGPQLHEKLPLPKAEPLPNETLSSGEAEVPKSAQVELFPAYESSIAQAQGGQNAKRGPHDYSLNFDDADLAEVAKVILGDILGKNYTISPQVSGRVTLQTTEPLAKEDLIPTLEMLLSLNDAALVAEAGMYLIKPANEAMYGSSFKTLGTARLASGYQTRAIPVHNVSAGEIADVLKPLLSEKALLHADSRRNILLVSGSATELNRIMDVVETFDVDVLKGRSFALFTPAHVDAGKVIEELEQIFNQQQAADKSEQQPYFRFIEIERLNAILAITHNAKYLQDIESWVFRLDRTNPDASGGVNVYRAQHVNALDLAESLNNIFGAGSFKGGKQASIAAGRKALSASNKTDNKTDSSKKESLMDKKLGDDNVQNKPTSSFQAGGNAAMDGVRIIPDDGNNALIIVANSEEYAKILRVVKQLDVLPLQVIIDATIVEVTLKDDLEYGIQWYLTHENGGRNIVQGGSAKGGLVGTASDSGINIPFTTIAKAVGTGGLSYAFSSRSGDINAILKANADKNNINVISSPSLMVLNNHEATIKVGDSVPIRSSVSSNLSSNTTTGIVQTSSIQMVDTGVILTVRPRVNSGGLVLMDILQSVNNAVPTDTSTNIDSPTIQKREIETNIAVQSGETLVLGGLIKEDHTYNRSGVPLLQELPLLGPLFGNTVRNKDKSELVVLITPRVVNSRQDAQLVTDEFRRKLSSIYQIPAEGAAEKALP